MNLRLNVANVKARIDSCKDFLTAGRLLSNRGLLSARLQASMGDLCHIACTDGSTTLAEVIGFDDEVCQLMPLQTHNAIASNARVLSLNRPFTVPVGPELLGRIVDALGNPLDGLGAIHPIRRVSVSSTSLNPMSRNHICEPFETGQKAIDALMTIGIGQRIGLFAGSGVGKSTLLGEIAKSAVSDINIVVLVGERGREVRPFVEDCLGPEGLQRSIVVVSTIDQPPLLRIRAAQTAVAQASWFRNAGCNVLFMLDSLTRLASAQRELGILLGEPPTSRGYPPSAIQLIAKLVERLGRSDRGSITGLLTVLVEGDDTNEPIADAARSVLDGHIVLDRKLAQEAHFPAIHVSRSLSRLFASLVDPQINANASAIRQILSTCDEVEDLVRIGAYEPGSSAEVDRAIRLKPVVDRFLAQQPGERFSISQSQKMAGEIARAWQSN